MATFVIATVSFLASVLTLFSGFGLGTILMPVVAVFFPVAVAVAITAFVHLLNNLFKLALLWEKVEWSVVLRFGIPAMIATVPGAMLLTLLSEMPEIHSYSVAALNASMTPVKLTVGLLLVVFATVEWLPVLKSINLSRGSLPAGGVLSGFFGGLSGHQGAFRSAFLIRAGLDKNQFIASNSAIAAMVDITRLVVYGLNIALLMAQVDASLLSVATLAAFAGALAGTFFLKKTTIEFIRNLVAVTLYILGVLLIAGLI